jgi:hypothetical protein
LTLDAIARFLARWRSVALSRFIIRYPHYVLELFLLGYGALPTLQHRPIEGVARVADQLVYRAALNGEDDLVLANCCRPPRRKEGVPLSPKNARRAISGRSLIPVLYDLGLGIPASSP